MSNKHILARLFYWFLFSQTLVGTGYAQDIQAFKISSVSTQLEESVYFLNAVIEIELPEYIVSAVDQGFDLPLVMEIQVYRQRNMWFDERVVYIRQQYKLRYHSVLDVVSILDLNAGQRRFYASLDDAIDQLSVFMHFPVLDHNSLLEDKKYNARLRFGIDVNELPLPLKSSSLWENNWELTSEWSSWEVKQ